MNLTNWIGYFITELIDGYENIESFLPKEEGLSRFRKKIERLEEKYEGDLSEAFNRLAYYRTATNIIHNADLIDPSIDISYGNIARFLADHLGIGPNDLEKDMKRLLTFHWTWKNRQRNGITRRYEKPLKLLEQDIWFLFEWLCSFHGKGGGQLYLEKWSQAHTRCELGWTDINEIVKYEELEIEKYFIRLVRVYKNDDLFDTSEIQEMFDELSSHDCFWPWARAFYDMHKSINTKGLIVFQQPRIIDFLIILTIRTEIVIRGIFSAVHGENPNDLKDIIKKSSESTLINGNEKLMLISIADNDWYLTDLRDMPVDIFQKIDNCTTGENRWGKRVRLIFKQILKFVAARNYSTCAGGLSCQLEI